MCEVLIDCSRVIVIYQYKCDGGGVTTELVQAQAHYKMLMPISFVLLFYQPQKKKKD